MSSDPDTSHNGGLIEPTEKLNHILARARERRREEDAEQVRLREERERSAELRAALQRAREFLTPFLDSDGRPTNRRNAPRVFEVDPMADWTRAPLDDPRWGEWADLYVEAGRLLNIADLACRLPELRQLRLEPVIPASVADIRDAQEASVALLSLACAGRREELANYLEAVHGGKLIGLIHDWLRVFTDALVRMREGLPAVSPPAPHSDAQAKLARTAHFARIRIDTIDHYQAQDTSALDRLTARGSTSTAHPPQQWKSARYREFLDGLWEAGHDAHRRGDMPSAPPLRPENIPDAYAAKGAVELFERWLGDSPAPSSGSQNDQASASQSNEGQAVSDSHLTPYVRAQLLGSVVGVVRSACLFVEQWRGQSEPPPSAHVHNMLDTVIRAPEEARRLIHEVGFDVPGEQPKEWEYRLWQSLCNARDLIIPLANEREWGSAVAPGTVTRLREMHNELLPFERTLQYLSGPADHRIPQALPVVGPGPVPLAEVRGQNPRVAGELEAHEPGKANNPPRATHSPDFASVNWFGTVYEFSPNQRKIVCELWAAWKEGAPSVGGDYLLEAADIKKGTRMGDVFRDSNAWGTMIAESQNRKGVYRLQEPGQS